MRNLETAVPQEWLWVYLEMNLFKHEPEGRAQGRSVTMEVALTATDQVIGLLERERQQLVEQYPPRNP
jgi:hypothetical protein